jgi:hypothetical protein
MQDDSNESIRSSSSYDEESRPEMIERWMNWISENPNVFTLFEKYAIDAIKAGRKRFGGQMIVERIRWYSTVETKGDDYKIRNEFVAFLTRMFEERNPEYKGFFYMKRSKADQMLLV